MNRDPRSRKTSQFLDPNLFHTPARAVHKRQPIASRTKSIDNTRDSGAASGSKRVRIDDASPQPMELPEGHIERTMLFEHIFTRLSNGLLDIVRHLELCPSDFDLDAFLLDLTIKEHQQSSDSLQKGISVMTETLPAGLKQMFADLQIHAGPARFDRVVPNSMHAQEDPSHVFYISLDMIFTQESNLNKVVKGSGFLHVAIQAMKMVGAFLIDRLRRTDSPRMKSFKHVIVQVSQPYQNTTLRALTMYNGVVLGPDLETFRRMVHKMESGNPDPKNNTRIVAYVEERDEKSHQFLRVVMHPIPMGSDERSFSKHEGNHQDTDRKDLVAPDRMVDKDFNNFFHHKVDKEENTFSIFHGREVLVNAIYKVNMVANVGSTPEDHPGVYTYQKHAARRVESNPAWTNVITFRQDINGNVKSQRNFSQQTNSDQVFLSPPPQVPCITRERYRAARVL